METVRVVVSFSKIEKIMRRFMNINDKTSIVSQQRLTAAIDRLNEHYKNNEFLVGHSFSRADLSAASLAAPLTMQKQYGLDWPTKLPKKLEELTDYSKLNVLTSRSTKYLFIGFNELSPSRYFNEKQIEIFNIYIYISYE
jgi:hypothetical protein